MLSVEFPPAASILRKTKIFARIGRSGRGFTLLEVVLAFTLLAIFLTVSLQLFSTGLRTSVRADQWATATMLAQSQLNALGLEQPLLPGETAGEFDNGYTWRLTVEPYSEPGTEFIATIALRAYALTLEVDVPGGGGRPVVLSTLRLQPALE